MTPLLNSCGILSLLFFFLFQSGSPETVCPVLFPPCLSFSPSASAYRLAAQLHYLCAVTYFISSLFLSFSSLQCLRALSVSVSLSLSLPLCLENFKSKLIVNFKHFFFFGTGAIHVYCSMTRHLVFGWCSFRPGIKLAGQELWPYLCTIYAIHCLILPAL